MKKRILVLVILNVLLFWTGVYASDLKTKESEIKELNEIHPVRENSLNGVYSKVLCVGCEGRKTIDHSKKCPRAKDLRAKVKSLVEKGFDKEKIVYNFNGENIAFIYQLPAKVIRNLNCACACGEKIWVCLASENSYSCPVIKTITQDIRKLKKQGRTDAEIVKLLKNSEYQQKYNLIIESAIKMAHQIQSYDISNIPDIVLENAKCTCACTESLSTCLEKMPWCKRISILITRAKVYLNIIGLSPEDTAKSIYAPCANLCAKRTGGRYLGKNCYACQRPVIDKAYYGEIDGKKVVFCCRSCYKMETPLPQTILDNVECKVCPCKKLLSECNSKHCPLIILEKGLIKTWLLQNMTQDEVIMKLK
jgi:cytochrome c-type biogenesis protein CcmH/NrfF